MLAAVVSVCLAGAVAAGGVGRPAARLWSDAMLTGTFSVVPGSAAAGTVDYRLRVRNSSAPECGVTGVPGPSLLDARGRVLETRARFAGPRSSPTAVLVPLGPGRGAALTARLSSGVPGEPPSVAGCERQAAGLRVLPSGGGPLVVAASPPTPVCEHGSLRLTASTAA
jgi:hypothetical protein